MKMNHTKENFKEIKKDFKGIGKALKNFSASTISLVVDTVKIPVSVCKDIRDRSLAKKEKVNKEPEELQEIISESTVQEAPSEECLNAECPEFVQG